MKKKTIVFIVAAMALLVFLLAIGLYLSRKSSEHVQDGTVNGYYLKMAQAIPLSEYSDEIPDAIEAQLMSAAYIGEDDIILAVKELIVSSMADMKLSSQEKEQICLKFSEESDVSIAPEDIALVDNFMQLDCMIDSVKYCYKVYASGRIIKEVSMSYWFVQYLVKNKNNELLAKIDGRKTGEKVERLSKGELAEFIDDIQQGLVPLMDTYTCEYVHAYLASKRARPAERGLETAQLTSSVPYLFVTSLSDAGFKPCTAKYIATVSGYCDGLYKYTSNNSNYISVDIYDTCRYVEVYMDCFEFDEFNTVLDIVNTISKPQNFVQAALLDKGIIFDKDGFISGPVIAIQEAEYRAVYTREGSFYENTFVRGQVEAYEVSGGCFITYGGTNPDSQGVFQQYVWGGSEVIFGRHEPIDYYHESYANLVARKYYDDVTKYGYWPFGSNRYGGLLDGTQFPEQTDAFFDNAD
jgi:hypothetical protein